MYTMTLLLIARKTLWFIYDLLTLNNKKTQPTHIQSERSHKTEDLK